MKTLPSLQMVVLTDTYNNASPENYDGYFTDLLDQGIDSFRMSLYNYTDSASNLLKNKQCVLRAIAAGAKVVWGITTNNLTAANWQAYRQAILDAALWAQENGVFEFQLGNEVENYIDGTTMTLAQLHLNLKSVATEVQQIFTRGNISYNTHLQSTMDALHTLGLGDIDLLSWEIYRGGNGEFYDDWMSQIDNLVSYFGDRAYIGEWNVSWLSMEDWSKDEAIQAQGLSQMIEYIRNSGITRAYFLHYIDESGNYLGARFYNGKFKQIYRTLFKSPLPVFLVTTAKLFSDNFESGNLSKWSTTVTDGGKLSVSGGAALHGSYGLQALIDSLNPKYVQDASPVAQGRYRFRFYFDPNSLVMGGADQFNIFRAFGLYSGSIFMKLTKGGGTFAIHVLDYTYGAYSKQTAYYNITDAPHCIEVDWQATTNSTSNDGWFSLWIDGVLKETVTGINSYLEHISYIKLGAVDELDAGTNGTILFDDFDSNNDGSEIGVL